MLLSSFATDYGQIVLLQNLVDRGQGEMKTVLSFDLVLDAPDTKFVFLSQFKDPGFLLHPVFGCRRMERPAALAGQT